MRTLVEEARVTWRGRDLSVTTYLRFPDSLRQEVRGEGYEGTSVLVGDRAVFRQGPLAGPLAPEDAALLRELRKNWVPLLGAEGDALEALPRETRGGRSCDAILARDARGRARRFLLDAETGLLAAVVARPEAPGTPEVEYSYGDWRRVGSLLWPHEVRISTGGVVTKEIRTVKVVANEDLPGALFEMP
ncbi:MAG: hypothetical protein L0216_20270 [Planctomycetales bacterium]|nr:hypothetical protein [Planctomycetales bacterium]